MANLMHYYQRARSVVHVNPRDASELGVDLGVAVGTGLGIALLASGPGLDKQIGGVNVPMDLAAGLAAGATGLQLHSRVAKVAAIAAVGAWSARHFGGTFKSSAHGEIEDWAQGYGNGYGSFGFGAAHDRLIDAAKRL